MARDNAQRIEGPAADPSRWRRFFISSTTDEEPNRYRAKSTLGILSDKETDEVPGTILLLSSNRNEPLGMRHQPHRLSSSSLPDPYLYPPSRSSSRATVPTVRSSSRATVPTVKKTSDGRIVLEPQPDDSANDPLNWPTWRRDAALLSLGFYCLVGGGMTPVLAAGFDQVAQNFGVSTQKVAYTTGLYMMGLGLGSVIMSPTAILWGKRPVYLFGAMLFIISAVWCAQAPDYANLVLARIFQGIVVSPVECLPSATIAEIFFLHERAYRVGIYTLLLLGGKNLVPLASAAVINRFGWRWVFRIVAMIVCGCLLLLFFLVPETFWDRTPRPRSRSRQRPHMVRTVSDLVTHSFRGRHPHPKPPIEVRHDTTESSPVTLRRHKHAHVGFADDNGDTGENEKQDEKHQNVGDAPADSVALDSQMVTAEITIEAPSPTLEGLTIPPPTHQLENPATSPLGDDLESARRVTVSPARTDSVDTAAPLSAAIQYTNRLRERPPITYVQSLKPWNGRIAHDSWLRAASRPFILFAYPAVLWSATVYSLSVGWLIVVSESISYLFQRPETYNFSPLQTGLIYMSPFVGGLLGTAVAGKVSDIVVRYMTRRNGGIYEPEFRLVMALPIALSTTAGLMAFGWSASLHDHWIVPTSFFGMISFGCSLGSTTSITFVVDSYRQYAGEALVTLNFSKNIFHGLVFSLFIVNWLETDGGRTVFLALGGIQLGFLLFSIPMYIYGKRARMWTVRKRLMEKF